jgi:hypothetical protein
MDVEKKLEKVLLDEMITEFRGLGGQQPMVTVGRRSRWDDQ